MANQIDVETAEGSFSHLVNRLAKWCEEQPDVALVNIRVFPQDARARIRIQKAGVGYIILDITREFASRPVLPPNQIAGDKVDHEKEVREAAHEAGFEYRGEHERNSEPKIDEQ